MRTLNLFLAAALISSAIVLAGPAGSDASQSRANYVVLDAKDQPLIGDFNADRGNVRLMFLVDPRCPECLRGLADMGDDLLSRLPKNARLKVYVVYEPVIGGSAQDIPAAAALLKTSIARNYWNPTGDFGREMSRALGYWNGRRWVYAWDTWLIYSPDAGWVRSAPPKPAWLMHQLSALEGNPRFPHLDSNVFVSKVREMLSAAGKTSTAQ